MAKNRASALNPAGEEAEPEKRLAKAERKASKRLQQVRGIVIAPPVANRAQPEGDSRPAMEQVEAEVERDLRNCQNWLFKSLVFGRELSLPLLFLL